MTFVIATCLIILFGAVAFRGAPYVPTHGKTIKVAFDMLPLEKGDLVLDLGSGDGSVLMHAARRGYRAVGYELNPILSFIAWLRCWRDHLHIRIHTADFWISTWPPDTKAVFIFLAGPYMNKFKRKLDAEMQKRDEPLYVISNGFTIPGALPKRVSSGLYLYEFKPR